MEKKKLQKTLDQKDKFKEQVKENEIELDNDEGSNEEEGYQFMAGKDRFDTMLKSMIARIEFNNCLAPI